jgi:hypothetical protein
MVAERRTGALIRPHRLDQQHVDRLIALEEELNSQYSPETGDEVVLVAYSKRDGRILADTIVDEQSS